MRFLALVTFTLIALVLLSGCEDMYDRTERGTDQADARQTQQAMAEASAQAGLPAITNFQERRFAKQIYELRDQEITTYTYIVDMNGNRHLLCESIGYGLPYSVQYSNPQRILHGTGPNGRSATLIPQPEPNGLWMPEGLDATWVLCSDGQGGVRPVYSEPQLVVSPFPLQ
jgi:hypothetical protein